MTKLAIIGAGGMAAYHINGFREGGAEVVAIADVNAEAAAKTAAQHGIEKSFGDVAEMFDALPDLDGVSIIVPNKFHARPPGDEGWQTRILRKTTRDQRSRNG